METSATEDNIFPCPFCGGNAEWEYSDINDDGTGKVECQVCHAYIFDDRDSAIEQWNKRALNAENIDAERYRKLREIALMRILAVEVEMKKLDSCKNKEEFDKTVDGIEVNRGILVRGLINFIKRNDFL